MATTPSTYNNEFESSRPPIRKILGGWAESGLKGLKWVKCINKNPSILTLYDLQIEEELIWWVSYKINANDSHNKFKFSERFQVSKSATSTIPTDDIPIIPDIDDIKDDILLNEIIEPPT